MLTLLNLGSLLDLLELDSVSSLIQVVCDIVCLIKDVLSSVDSKMGYTISSHLITWYMYKHLHCKVNVFDQKQTI